MRLSHWLCLPAAVLAAAAPLTSQTAVDWKAVDAALGRAGAMQPGNVYKYGFPRGDLAVTVGAVRVKPALALGSWVAFVPAGAGAVVMGDLVLREAEVAPVMAKLTERGIDVTALHHHLLHESPRVYYMHIHGAGDPVALAQGIHAALALTGTPKAAPAPAAPAPLALDTARIAATLGHAGKVNGGVYQVGVARPDTIREGEMVIPPAMGVATSLNFQPVAGGKAAVTGDFVLHADEVPGVLRALETRGITVTAVHSHMLAETPRLLFMHFWGVDEPSRLAAALRAGLDLIGAPVRP
ncbi:MAG TPA: DUF1259 domain-containing protein [Gemmatimonadales bacterium]